MRRAAKAVAGTLAFALIWISLVFAFIGLGQAVRPVSPSSPRVAHNDCAWREFTVAAGNVPPLTQGATQR